MKSLNVNLAIKISIYLGISLVGVGYLLNSGFQTILENNIDGFNADMKETYTSAFSYKRPITASDNTAPKYSFILKDYNCKLLPHSLIRDTIESDYLTVLNQNLGFKHFPEYSDLVYLKSYGIESNPDTRLRKAPAQALQKMFTAMQKSNLKPYVNSGFRTINEQKQILASWTAALGSKAANQMAAKPGFSEHHLGTTIDILSQENNLKLLPSYETTKVSNWLKNNAYKYGFVMSYPKDSTGTTGYTYEPWHYRYIGTEIATDLYTNKTLLQDYLYQINNYCLVSK